MRGNRGPAPDHGKDRAVDIAGQCLSQLRRHILGSAEFEVGDDMPSHGFISSGHGRPVCPAVIIDCQRPVMVPARTGKEDAMARSSEKAITCQFP
jgi:hypothetical protein